MEGSTNAVIVQGGTPAPSGGGDLVYAVNDTDKTLAEGDKVWLNVVTNENDYIQNVNFNNQSDSSYIPYSIGNNIFVGPNKYVWDGTTFNTRAMSQSIRITYTPVVREWGVFFKNNKTVVLANEVTFLTTHGGVLNDKYSIYSGGICTYDHTTGEETVIAEKPQASYTTAYMDDDSDAIMFWTQDTKTFDIYEDFHNPSEGHRTFTVSDYAYPMWVTNGLVDNSYFICNMATTYPYRIENATPLVIYKLYNNTLTPAMDLPDSLQHYMRRSNTWAMYRDDTKILTIVDLKEMCVHAWQIVNNKFKDLLTIPFPHTKNPNNPDRLAIAMFNNDMTQMATYYYYSTGYTYHIADVVHYNIIDGKYHIASYVYDTESTLSGFATGETNEDNEVEVKTILPPEVTMTFNITPDEDTFSYKGITA